jgi:hypothetical protein
MIPKVENMNMKQENHEEGQETNTKEPEKIRGYIIVDERNIE